MDLEKQEEKGGSTGKELRRRDGNSSFHERCREKKEGSGQSVFPPFRVSVLFYVSVGSTSFIIICLTYLVSSCRAISQNVCPVVSAPCCSV